MCRVILDKIQKTTSTYLTVLTELEKELDGLTELHKFNAGNNRDLSNSPFVDKFDYHDVKEQEQLRLIVFELNNTLREKIEEMQKSNLELQERISKQGHSLNELAQEKEISIQTLAIFNNTIDDLRASSDKMQKIILENNHEAKEREQVRLISLEINEALNEKLEDLEESKNGLECMLAEQSKANKELEQEKILLTEISEHGKKTSQRVQNRYYVTIAIMAVGAAAGFVGYSYYENQTLMSEQTHVGNYNSPFLIQNLRGDVVNTYVSWKLLSGQVLSVNIQNDAGLEPDKLFAVKNAILSTETVVLDDSLLKKGPPGTSSVYYKGWQGALASAASKTTDFYIPQQFKITDDPNGAGDIVVKITNDLNPDGLSGFTRDTADGNQILKSTITIYNANQLSADQIGAIMRHEFGHAMGLAHSTAPEDLMHPTIQTNYPYISQCDIDAVTGLYNGDKQSQVVCQK